MLYVRTHSSSSHPSLLPQEPELAHMLVSGLRNLCVSSCGPISSQRSASKSSLMLSEQVGAQGLVRQNAGSLLTILSMMVLTYSLSRQVLLFIVLQHMLARLMLLRLGQEEACRVEDVHHLLKPNRDVPPSPLLRHFHDAAQE